MPGCFRLSLFSYFSFISFALTTTQSSIDTFDFSSQELQQRINTATPHSTLSLAPGVYECGLSVVFPLSFVASSPGTVIFDCLGTSSAFSLTLPCDGVVSFEGIAFLNAYSEDASAIMATGVSDLRLISCTFSSNTVNTVHSYSVPVFSEVQVVDLSVVGTVTVDNSNCSQTSNVLVESCSFINNTVFSNYTLDILNPRACDNYVSWWFSAWIGAAVAVLTKASTSTVVVVDTVFESNTASLLIASSLNSSSTQYFNFGEVSETDPPGLYLSGAVVLGTINTPSTIVSLNHSTFSKNSASLSLASSIGWNSFAGSAAHVLIADATGLTTATRQHWVQNSTFQDGRSNLDSGLFFLRTLLNAVVSSFVVVDLTPSSHRAIDGLTSVSFCTFSNNDIVPSVAGISFAEVVASGAFARVSAYPPSSNITVSPVLVTISSSTFSDNAVTASAVVFSAVVTGAIAITFPAFSDEHALAVLASVTMTGVQCFGNRAVFGRVSTSGIELFFNLFLSGCSGVRYAISAQLISCSIRNNTVSASGNMALQAAGGFVVWDFIRVTIISCDVSGNNVTTSDDPTLAQNDAPYLVGGGVLLYRDTYCPRGYVLPFVPVVTDCDISDNLVTISVTSPNTTTIVMASSLNIYSSRDYGQLYLTLSRVNFSGNSVYVSDLAFESTVMASGGVSINWKTWDTSSHVSDCLFSSNSVVMSSGPGSYSASSFFLMILYLLPCNALTVSNVRVSGGLARNGREGASFLAYIIEAAQCTFPVFTFDNLTVVDNLSEGLTSGLYIYNDGVGKLPVTIGSSLFRNNTGGVTGGGLSVVGPVDVTIHASTFTYNAAVSGGAISLPSLASVSVSNSFFEGNDAAGMGGAIAAMTTSSLFVENSTFNNNTSAYGSSIMSMVPISLLNCSFSFASSTQSVLSFPGVSEASLANSSLQCVPGAEFDFTHHALLCRQCSPGSYSFIGGSSSQPSVCVLCPMNGVGVDCSAGGSDVKVTEGYWGAIVGAKSSLTPTPPLHSYSTISPPSPTSSSRTPIPSTAARATPPFDLDAPTDTSPLHELDASATYPALTSTAPSPPAPPVPTSQPLLESDTFLPTVWITPCPSTSGCCAAPRCQLGQQCSGNHRGPLCALCESGYSLSLQTGMCVPHHDCGTPVSGLGMLVVVLVCGAFVAFLIHRNSQLNHNPTGILSMLAYYYQILPLVTRLSKKTSSARSVMSVSNLLTSLFGLHVTDSNTREPASQFISSLFCPSPSLTPLSVLVSSFAMPGILFLWFLLFGGGLWVYTRGRRRMRRLFRPVTQRGKSTKLLELASPLADVEASSSTSADQKVTFRQRVALWANPVSLWTVLWTLLGFMYNTLLLGTMNMLDCVTIPGDDGQLIQVLFKAADSQCWVGPLQYFFAIVVGPVLVIYPVIILVLVTRSLSEAPWREGLLLTLAPYRHKWWGPVVLLRRLVVVLLFVFVGDAIVQSWALAVVSSLVLILHLRLSPMVSRTSTVLETFLLTSLSWLSVQSVAVSVFAYLGVYPSHVDLFSVIAQILTVGPAVFGVLLFLCILVSRWYYNRQQR